MYTSSLASFAPYDRTTTPHRPGKDLFLENDKAEWKIHIGTTCRLVAGKGIGKDDDEMEHVSSFLVAMRHGTSSIGAYLSLAHQTGAAVEW